jgi:hypothetical protein
MTLIHPDSSSVTDCRLKKVIPERLPGSIIFPIYTIIRTDLVSSIHVIHKVVVYIDEIRDLKKFKWLISERFFNPFIPYIWPLSKFGNSRTSVDNCRYKENDLRVFLSQLKNLLIRRKTSIYLSLGNMV